MPQNNDEALRLYRLAADQGEAIAQSNVGAMYYHGIVVPQSYAEALKWLRKAADQGHPFSQLNLAQMYKTGDGVPQDYAEALKWCRLAADQGNADAYFQLGVLYAAGAGVPQDDATALSWFQKAADQATDEESRQRAVHNHGLIASIITPPRRMTLALVRYIFPPVVARFMKFRASELAIWYKDASAAADRGDYATARRLWRLLADQGYSSAQYKLGHTYANGDGVAQDYAAAVSWYRKAADKGHADAQNMLGAMYATARVCRRTT